jgi:hypothetical protein
MNKKLVLAFAVLALSALACGFDFNTGGADEDSNVLFQDDFSSTSSGWDRSTFEAGSTDYENGSYRITVLEESYSVWANPGREYDDVHVEVDATKSGGPDDNEFGIICRYQNAENFYVGVLTSDGYYGFWKRVSGAELELIGMELLGTSEEINLGDASNHLRLDCIGDTLSLYANGTLVGEVQDSTLTSGDVGLYAGTFEQAGADILFDNFVVYRP